MKDNNAQTAKAKSDQPIWPQGDNERDFAEWDRSDQYRTLSKTEAQKLCR